jgi:hypothetical protein
MCYSDDDDAVRLGAINYAERKISNKHPACILGSG